VAMRLSAYEFLISETAQHISGSSRETSHISIMHCFCPRSFISGTTTAISIKYDIRAYTRHRSGGTGENHKKFQAGSSPEW
jgi:hypothetical protein